jgi:hypothetical protein
VPPSISANPQASADDASDLAAPEWERVKLAIARLSQADLNKVAARVDLAMTDYKEKLMLEAERPAGG